MGLFSYIKKLFKPRKEEEFVDIEDLDLDGRQKYVNRVELKKSLESNIKLIKDLYGKSFDLNVRKFKLGKKEIEGALIYMSGMVDTVSIEEIMENVEVDYIEASSDLKNIKETTYETVFSRLLKSKQIEEVKKPAKLLNDISLGSTALLIDGVPRGILCETKGFEVRDISEPNSEIALWGPRDGFVENIFTNTSLIRRRLRIPHLWIQDMEIGSLSRTNVAIAYIKGLASDELVKEVKSRLKKIDIDNLMESGYLQEYLKDQPFTLFPLINRTERPDKVVSCLVEGKIAILTNNTPFVLVLPMSFNMFMQSADDYYQSFPIGSFIRLLRYTAYAFSIFLPGIYVAVINFHTELLPVSLLLRIQATREGVPFPVIVESLLMEIILEVLREAGLRLPRAIGSAISIIGALVVGEAAISAGLVSPPMVIIVAITAISSFTTPDYNLATTARLLRFVYIFLGGTLGLFGIQFGFLLLIIHLTSLRTFGHPYMQPLAPFIWQDWKDFIVRSYWWQKTSRPKLIGGRNPQRQEKDQKPEPPDGGGN